MGQYEMGKNKVGVKQESVMFGGERGVGARKNISYFGYRMQG